MHASFPFSLNEAMTPPGSAVTILMAFPTSKCSTLLTARREFSFLATVILVS